jgi:hypothetical protein
MVWFTFRDRCGNIVASIKQNPVRIINIRVRDFGGLLAIASPSISAKSWDCCDPTGERFSTQH